VVSYDSCYTLDVRGVCEVRGMRLGMPARGVNAVRNGRKSIAVSAQKNDGCAAMCQSPRCRGTNATRATRDQCETAIDFHRSLSPCRGSRLSLGDSAEGTP
jgi:hypothetical protein